MEQKPFISRIEFLGGLVVCLAILAGANFLVQRLTAHTVSRRILAEAQGAGSSEVIALGNSLMRSGFVAEAFAPPRLAQAESRAINLAMGASTPVEQLLLLRAGLRSMPHARVLLYGFYDFQLTDPVSYTSADLIGNHDLLYYDEPEFARRYYQMSPYDSRAFEVARRFAMLSERGAVWAKVELLRRGLSQQGMPAQTRNRFGRAADFTLLEAKNRENFEEHCAAASQAPLNAPVAEIVREAREKGMHVVVIVMPLPPKHVQEFYDSPGWTTYQRHIRELLAVENVAYVDASRWIPEATKFGDALHLGDEGAQEFSRRLSGLCDDIHDSSFCSGR